MTIPLAAIAVELVPIEGLHPDPANPRRVETVRGVGYRFNP